MGTTGASASRRAWSRLYGLLGHLLLDGWTPQALRTARSLPALAQALPDLDAEHLAARHHAAFGTGVPPYVGVLVGLEGHMGGDRAREASDLLRRTGLRTTRRDVEADHVGMLLRAAGFLCAAEADAVEDGRDAVIPGLRDLQTELLDRHLLLAWPPLRVAVEGLGLPEWDAVLGLAGELLVTHRAELGAAGELSLEPVPGDLLDDPRTGLKRVARWLTVCGQTGCWITRADVDALAAAADVARGFGDRAKMLESLLFAAVDHQRIDQVLDAFLERIDSWDARYRELGQAGLPTEPWRQRTRHTRQLVQRLREASAGSLHA